MSSLLVLVEFKILKPKLPQKGIGVTYRNQSVQMLCIFQPIKVAIEENQKLSDQSWSRLTFSRQKVHLQKTIETQRRTNNLDS